MSHYGLDCMSLTTNDVDLSLLGQGGLNNRPVFLAGWRLGSPRPRAGGSGLWPGEGLLPSLQKAAFSLCQFSRGERREVIFPLCLLIRTPIPITWAPTLMTSSPPKHPASNIMMWGIRFQCAPFGGTQTFSLWHLLLI